MNNDLWHAQTPGPNKEWLQIDTLTVLDVRRVALIDRRDNSRHRFHGYQARVGNTPTTGGLQLVSHNKLCGQMSAENVERRNYVFECEGGVIRGRYVTVQRTLGGEVSHMQEVIVDDAPEVPKRSLMKGKQMHCNSSESW